MRRDGAAVPRGLPRLFSRRRVGAGVPPPLRARPLHRWIHVQLRRCPPVRRRGAGVLASAGLAFRAGHRAVTPLCGRKGGSRRRRGQPPAHRVPGRRRRSPGLLARLLVDAGGRRLRRGASRGRLVRRRVRGGTAPGRACPRRSRGSLEAAVGARAQSSLPRAGKPEVRDPRRSPVGQAGAPPIDVYGEPAAARRSGAGRGLRQGRLRLVDGRPDLGARTDARSHPPRQRRPEARL